MVPYETLWDCVSLIDTSSACAAAEAARVHASEIPRSATATGPLGACPLAWASGDFVLVATHSDESRSFSFVSDIVQGALEGVLLTVP